MTAQNRSVNKARFENGDTPQGSDFTDFIDSYLALTDSTAQSVVSHVTLAGGLATTTVSAAGANVVTLSAAALFSTTANIARCFTNFVQITNSASDSNWVFTVSTTVAASGGAAGAVPASAAGFLHVQINNFQYRVPFFNPK